MNLLTSSITQWITVVIIFNSILQVNELQVSDRQYKDLVALAITLAEKLVNGKMNKQQYLENEKINKTKREELDSKMEALRSSLA